MKQFLFFLSLLLLFAGCSKTKLTPCGDDIDTYTFPHHTIRTDSSFILSNEGDRSVMWALSAYQSGLREYMSYSDTIPGYTHDTIALNEMWRYDLTYHFSDTVHYDSIRIEYYIYEKVCRSQTGNVGWIWMYWPYTTETYFP